MQTGTIKKKERKLIMADEVSQVVEFECKGCVYLLKGTKEMIAYMGKLIMAMKNWGHEHRMNAEGPSSWKKIQEVSEGTPVILNFPKEMFEKTMQDPKDGDKFISPFELYCREHKLRYCKMPDLNPDDGYIPIAVPCQDAGIHSQQIEHYMKRKIVKEEAKDEDYAIKIEKAKETIARAGKEKEEAEELLKMLEEGKGENEKILQKSKEQMEKGNVLDFDEYLMMGKGTIFETNPEAAIAQAQLGGIVREYMPEECMYPVRDEAMVPDSREMYYSQKADDDTLVTVKRNFYSDENGIVYSNYKVIDPMNPGNVRIFSDRGIDVEVWKKQLPDLLKEAGMKKEIPTMAMHSEERLKKYLEGLDLNFTNAGERTGSSENDERIQEVTELDNNEEADTEINGGYSSEETKQYVEETEKENEQRAAYERSQYITVTVPAACVMADGSMELSLELEEGLVHGVELVSIEHEQAVIRIKEDADYVLEQKDGNTCAITGVDIMERYNGLKSESTAQSASRSSSRR